MKHAVESELEQKISATDARQGRRGTQILTVLVIGLLLAGVAWLGVEFYGESIDRSSQAQPAATGQSQPQPDQPSTAQSQTAP